MLTQVSLRARLGPQQRRARHASLVLLQTQLSCRRSVLDRQSQPADLTISLDDWSNDVADALAFDRLFHNIETGGDFSLALTSFDWVRGGRSALELLTRYQRLLPLPPEQSWPGLDDILSAHRALHDLQKPLVRADFDHALDTWRWLLRLSPTAPPSLQLAALFHDIERLESEPDARSEHLAPDYATFKARHAARGGDLTERTLSGLGLGRRLVERAAELVARHERPGNDAQLGLLNDADALSFFSLNSWGYLRYFGVAQTFHKVGYTLARMSYRARDRLESLRHPPLVRSMLLSMLGQPLAGRAGGAHA